MAGVTVQLTTKAFVTGSRAYGTPRPDSDIDLVCLLDEGDRIVFEADVNGDAGDGTEQELYESAGVIALRFGKLNLLLCLDEDAYRTWEQGTRELRARKPVTRDEAVEHFRALRKAAALERAETKKWAEVDLG